VAELIAKELAPLCSSLGPCKAPWISGKTPRRFLVKELSLHRKRASSRIAGMPAQVLPRLRPKVLIAAVFVALPPILFYAILFHKAMNVPLEDDYEALLDFLNQMAELRSVSAKASYFLAVQFNEYKLFFGHGLVWLQFALFGRIDIRLLCALGNGFVLLLAILLWKMFLPNREDFAYRMAFFVPVSWLLFQLQYVETLNWAMPSLANLPVLVFSLGAIFWCERLVWRSAGLWSA
jgi:hypothetical protein